MKIRTVTPIILLIVIVLAIAAPVVAFYYGGSIVNFGLSGSEASWSVGLDGGLASNTISLLPGSVERVASINMLSEILGVAIAGSIILGVLTTFISHNPIVGLVGSILGFIALLFVQVVVSLL